MLKKIFSVTVAIFFLTLSTTCAAMTFQQLVKIGSVSQGDRSGSIKIFDATKIDATRSSQEDCYVKGTATFGTLYLHFDGESFARKIQRATTSDDMIKIYSQVSFFGGSDVKNSVAHFVFEGRTNIYRLPNDAGIEMYLLEGETGGGGVMKVIGNRAGKWVNFFDTNDTKKNYGIGRDFFLNDLRVVGDEIIFVYRSGSEQNSCRELHYKWNAAAQWFGVSCK